MALGGGTFLTQNKKLPGAYINFVSTAYASATLSDRGYATMPLALDWGAENEVMTIELADFQKNSLKLLGYAYTSDVLKPLREVFLHAKTLYLYNLCSGGKKASNAFATAKYPGVRGNDLSIIIEQNEDKTTWDVTTLLDGTAVEMQEKVATAAKLVDNDYVTFTDDAELAETANTPLSGGTTGTVASAAYQTYLDKIESYTFNAIGVVSNDSTVNSLFVSFVKRMRDDVGKKFQAVLFRTLSDYEGVVSVKNTIKGATDDPALIPWVLGVVAGTAVNKSATNMAYDGEYEVDTDYTQTQLEAGIAEGSFMFHLVDGAVNVLTDINSFISITDEKSSDFSNNQVIRVLDQIANDIAVLFGKKYIGKIQNDAAGRTSLWSDIKKHHDELQQIRAIEDFTGDDLTVEKGDTKKSVVVTDPVTPVCAMEQLYMTVYVS